MDNFIASDWEARIKRGRATEERFIRYCIEHHWLNVVRTSQHVHHPDSMLARHFPDIFIMECRAFVQVKDGLRSSEWPTVIGEQDSIDACRVLHEMGNIVWVVWEYPDRTFHGNEVQRLTVDSMISKEARQHGSGTPAYKIRKFSLRKLADLISGPQQLTLDIQINGG